LKSSKLEIDKESKQKE